MPAANTDKFKKGKDLFSTTLSSGIGQNDTTIPLNSVSGLPTDTAVTLTIDATSSGGAATPTLREVVTGVISGSNLTSVVRGKEGTQQAHSSGAVVTEYFTKTHWNDLNDGVLQEHQQDGNHAIPANYDSNGNKVFEWITTASALNWLSTTNAATGTNPKLSATGQSNRGFDLYDSNGNELLKTSSTASAINEFTVANAASGTGPTLSATGGGTDVDINVTPKGAGNVNLTPPSTGQVIGTNLKSKGHFINSVSKTSADSPYTILATDDIVLANATSGAITATLPTAASITGREITIIKTDSSANVVTIATTSSQTINGSTNDYLPNQYDKVTYISDGSNWLISAERRNPLLKVATVTSNAATTSATSVAITGATVNPYVPAGSRKIIIRATNQDATTVSGGTANAVIDIWDGTVGSGTQVAQIISTSTAGRTAHSVVETTPITIAAGNSKTYNAGMNVSGGFTFTITAGSTRPFTMEALLV